jgi:hypothetical protein
MYIVIKEETALEQLLMTVVGSSQIVGDVHFIEVCKDIVRKVCSQKIVCNMLGECSPLGFFCIFRKILGAL